MIISIIVATASNHVIGNQGTLPWHLPADMQHFKTLTMGHHVIMGRKTFASIPKGLPGRKMIVLSHNPHLHAKGAIVMPHLEDALQVAAQADEQEVFIAGGASIYQEAIPLANKIYLTAIEATVMGDTFFPAVDAQHWQTISSIYHPPDEQHAYGFYFMTLARCE